MSASGILTLAFSNTQVQFSCSRLELVPAQIFMSQKNAPVLPTVVNVHLGLLYLQPEFRLCPRGCKAQVISWTSLFGRTVVQLKGKN